MDVCGVGARAAARQPHRGRLGGARRRRPRCPPRPRRDVIDGQGPRGRWPVNRDENARGPAQEAATTSAAPLATIPRTKLTAPGLLSSHSSLSWPLQAHQATPRWSVCPWQRGHFRAVIAVRRLRASSAARPALRGSFVAAPAFGPAESEDETDGAPGAARVPSLRDASPHGMSRRAARTDPAAVRVLERPGGPGPACPVRPGRRRGGAGRGRFHGRRWRRVGSREAGTAELVADGIAFQVTVHPDEAAAREDGDRRYGNLTFAGLNDQLYQRQ